LERQLFKCCRTYVQIISDSLFKFAGLRIVANGGKASKPADPISADSQYIFADWWEAQALHPWNFDTDTVTANIILYARWVEKTVAAEANKEALQEAGEIVLPAKDSSGADVVLAIEVVDDTITISVAGGDPIEYPIVITHSDIILEGAGSDGGDVSLGYVINDDGTLAITGGLDQIAGAGLSGDPVVSQPNEDLIKPEVPFVAVTSITGVPTGGTAGSEVDLSGAVVAPGNANNKTIVWTVKSAGGTGVTTAGIVNGKFTPANAGTLTLTATIANGTAEGTNYTGDFVISISAQGVFVPVTNITGVPTGGTEGSEVDLSGAVVAPGNATNKTIVWTVQDAGTTGVGNAGIVNNKFTPASAGTLTLTATIANGTAEGTAFAKEDFAIIISPPNTFVPVTNITGVPTGGTAGVQVDLSTATVVPDNATNQTIAWTVKNAGTTGLTNTAIVDGKFTAPAAGTVKLTAAIANGEAEGTDYTRDFDIPISVPGAFVAVTNITGVPLTGTVNTPVSLASATVVPSTATYQTISWRVKTAGAGLAAGDITGNSFTPTAAGKVVVEAVILSGAAAMQPYTKDFEITINPAFVAVTGINGLPETRNAVTDVEINLAAGLSVVPDTATNKTIVWSIKTGETHTTGLTDTDVASGSFTPANAGTVTLTATIVNGLAQGSNYTQDITLTIIKPVTGITGIPTNGTRGYEVDLTGAVVEPTDATNKTIIWTVSEAGTTGVADNDLEDGKFTPGAAGTLKLIATIVNGRAMGTDYTRNATITINEPGETTPEIGLGEDSSIILKDKNGTALSKDGVNEINQGDAAYYVSISGYTDIVWRINGTAQPGITASLIYPDTSTAGTITIAMQGKKNGKLESSGTYTFEIK
jgi:endo-1,4-beta-xylanase